MEVIGRLLGRVRYGGAGTAAECGPGVRHGGGVRARRAGRTRGAGVPPCGRVAARGGRVTGPASGPSPIYVKG
ncbi:hypothetical protein GCM10017667_46480 [Streptomyces filamentosus]|uniref:Uncharacterized protein n=1 Tax=Streptomyces filamentosus TaxID=67294 RepID=A0A919EQP7_STRFL|nr:hypothetical protein GCM10017667_46480 [Streptomyces filamentosus]